MTEQDAKDWIAARFGRELLKPLTTFAEAVVAERARQNLIAPSTVDRLWVRHILDSAQLIDLAPAEGRWIDVGTGAGFPGMVVAILRNAPVHLVEPRRRRADFLQTCKEQLALDHVVIEPRKIEAMALPAPVISARAVALPEKLLHAAAACGTKETRWLLPRGRVTADELTTLRHRWKGTFHVKQSLTDPDSSILICDGPAAR